MQFLIDQGLPRSTVAELQVRGHVAHHVGLLGMAKSADEQILETARHSGAVVATLDADFHTLLAINRSTDPSVIRIRIEGLKGNEIAETLDRVVAVAEPELQAGAAVSVTRTSIRVRRLPLA